MLCLSGFKLYSRWLPLHDITLVAIFHIFVYGDIVYAQTLEVLTLENLIVSSHFFVPTKKVLRVTIVLMVQSIMHNQYL